MTEDPLPRLTLRQRWHRLRTSPRFLLWLACGLLLIGGGVQAYCYWWGVRIQQVVAINSGTVERIKVFPIWVRQTFGKHIEPLEPVRAFRIYPGVTRRGKIAAEDLRPLRGALFLRELVLGGELSPGARDQLKCLTQLRSLYYHQSTALKDDAPAIAALPRLESLTLSYSNSLSGELYKTLAGMKQLKRLCLSPYNSEVPDEVRELARSTSLRRLEGQFRKDQQLLELTSLLPDGRRPLPDLRELCLSQSSVTDAGLANLKNLPSLVHLDLSQTAVSDEGLEHLKPLPYLRTLYLAGDKITDRGAATLASMHGLESLNLNSTRVTEAGILQLATLPRLRHLRVALAHGEFLEKLRQRLPPGCRIDHH